MAIPHFGFLHYRHAQWIQTRSSSLPKIDEKTKFPLSGKNKESLILLRIKIRDLFTIPTGCSPTSRLQVLNRSGVLILHASKHSKDGELYP